MRRIVIVLVVFAAAFVAVAVYGSVRTGNGFERGLRRASRGGERPGRRGLPR